MDEYQFPTDYQLPDGPMLDSPLVPWEVKLRDRDHSVTINAHTYRESGTDYIFEVMVKGEPIKLLEIAKVPKSLVAAIRTLPPE